VKATIKHSLRTQEAVGDALYLHAMRQDFRALNRLREASRELDKAIEAMELSCRTPNEPTSTDSRASGPATVTTLKVKT